MLLSSLPQHPFSDFWVSHHWILSLKETQLVTYNILILFSVQCLPLVVNSSDHIYFVLQAKERDRR